MNKKREFDGLLDLDEKAREMVEAVRKDEDIEIQNAWVDDGNNNIININAKGKKFTILKGGEEQGERMAKEYLEDGERWQSAVEERFTTLGLDDWIDCAVVMGGWEGEICNYDCKCRHTKTGNGKEVVYYRSI